MLFKLTFRKICYQFFYLVVQKESFFASQPELKGLRKKSIYNKAKPAEH
jgi:hypothetical protein